tara:strand:- start:59 stop:343 length:285 start_codon:yes stop_codon:yes gene_type:complete
MCQKIINVLAVASFAVSSSIAAGGVYVYVNRDSIIDGIKSQVMGGFGGAALGGGALTGDVGIPKTPIDTQPQAAAPSPTMSGDSMGLPVPGSAF